MPNPQAPHSPHGTLRYIDPSSRDVAAYGSAIVRDGTTALRAAESLWLSGMPPAACTALRDLTALRRLTVHDWRKPDLEDLAALPLEQLAINGSSRLKSLAGLERIVTLRELILFDCCGYTIVDPIDSLRNLTALCLEGGFSKSVRITTLRPLSGLSHLRTLRLASIGVVDKSLRPLGALTNLESVFIAGTFPATELRWLAAALPNTRGEFLDSHRR